MITRSPRIVHKPWGHEEIFAITDRYVGKILCITAGEALSLQYHEHKEETLRILDGSLEVQAGPAVGELASYLLKPGDVFHIHPRLLHRMIAISDCRLLEVSTAELDDVVRLEDRYGREGTTAP